MSVRLQLQSNDRYVGPYDGFVETSIYRIVIHAKDKDELEARPVVVEVKVGETLFLPLVVR